MDKSSFHHRHQQPVDKSKHQVLWMTANTEKAFRCVQVFGIIHFINSIIILLFGISILIEAPIRVDINDNAAPVWTSVIFFVTGLLGIIIFVQRKKVRRSVVVTHSVFAIFTYFFAIVLIIVGAVGMSYYNCEKFLRSERTKTVTIVTNSTGVITTNTMESNNNFIFNPAECSYKFIDTYIQPLYGMIILFGIIEIVASILSIVYSFQIYNCCKYGCCRCDDCYGDGEKKSKSQKYQMNYVSTQPHNPQVIKQGKAGENLRTQQSQKTQSKESMIYINNVYEPQIIETPQFSTSQPSSQTFSSRLSITSKDGISYEPEKKNIIRSSSGDEFILMPLPKQEKVEHQVSWVLPTQHQAEYQNGRLPRQQYINPTLQPEEAPKKTSQKAIYLPTSKEYVPEKVNNTHIQDGKPYQHQYSNYVQRSHVDDDVIQHVPNLQPSKYLQSYDPTRTSPNDFKPVSLITQNGGQIIENVKQHGSHVKNLTKQFSRSDLPALIS